jgi:hypothetical protein
VTETQDLQKGAYEHLDDVQQRCMTAFASSEAQPMDAYLSGKVDGSLVIVSAYPRGTRESRMMSDILATCGDPFSNALAEACVEADMEANQGPPYGPLITVATGLSRDFPTGSPGSRQGKANHPRRCASRLVPTGPSPGCCRSTFPG